VILPLAKPPGYCPAAHRVKAEPSWRTYFKKYKKGAYKWTNPVFNPEGSLGTTGDVYMTSATFTAT